MLNENISDIRKITGISQRELGRRISMSGQYIAKIEKGDRKPTIETLNKIANALNFEPGELLNSPKILNNKLIDILEKRNISITELSKETGLTVDEIFKALTNVKVLFIDELVKIGMYLGFTKKYIEKYSDFDSKKLHISQNYNDINLNLVNKFNKWIGKFEASAKTTEELLKKIESSVLPTERKDRIKHFINETDYELKELNSINVSEKEAFACIKKLVAYSKPSVGPNGSQYETILNNVLTYIEFELYKINKERDQG